MRKTTQEFVTMGHCPCMINEQIYELRVDSGVKVIIQQCLNYSKNETSTGVELRL